MTRPSVYEAHIASLEAELAAVRQELAESERNFDLVRGGFEVTLSDLAAVRQERDAATQGGILWADRCEKLREALTRIERNAESNGDEFTRMLAVAALESRCPDGNSSCDGSVLLHGAWCVAAVRQGDGHTEASNGPLTFFADQLRAARKADA